MKTYISSEVVLRQVGMSWRQLDYWAVQGHVRAVELYPGTGQMRMFEEDEVKIAKLIQRLLTCGLTLKVASPIAREIVEDELSGMFYDLGNGVVLTIDLAWKES